MRDNLRGKNLSVPDSQQDWWKSSQPARCTSVQPATGLTVKFPSRRPGSLVGGVGREENGCGPRGWGGRGFWQITLVAPILQTKSPQTPWIVFFPAALAFEGNIVSSTAPSQQNFAWRTHSLRNRYIGCPCICYASFQSFHTFRGHPTSLAFLDVRLLYVMFFMLLHDKFLQFDWLGAVVFRLNLKYLHVKITNLLLVIV